MGIIGLHLYEIYKEEADTDEERTLLGTLRANTMGEALHLASQYYEIPSHDLVAVQIAEVNRHPPSVSL